MTFLSKLGQFLAKAMVIIGIGEPLIQPFLGSAAPQVDKAVNDFTQIGQVVVQAEALIQGSGTGPQKLQAAAPLVQNIVKTSELVSGKKIANETLFIASCQQLTSAVAGILNGARRHDARNCAGEARQQRDEGASR